MKKRVCFFFLAAFTLSFAALLTSCNVPNNNTTQPATLPTLTPTP